MRTILCVASLVALAACSSEPAGLLPLHTVLDGLPAGLDVRFRVTPETVSQHQSFDVRLEITNTTDDTVRVVTANGCLAIPNVLRGNVRIPVQGSLWGCYAAVTTHTFAPGQTRTIRWQMSATLYDEQLGVADGAPLPKGRYIVQAEFDIYVPGSNRKPVVELQLTVE